MNAGGDMQRTVAITGATGFVGSRLARVLEDRGTPIRLLVRRPEALWSDQVRRDARALDLGRDELAPDLFAGVDCVCNLAAYLPKDYDDPNDARACLEVNALGTLRLLEAATSAGVRQFVQVSSGNAYRAGPGRVSEDAAMYPSARAPYYLSSKLCGEIYADHFGRRGRLDVSIVRLSSVYGAGMTPGGLVQTFASRLKDRSTVELHDGGRHRVDLVHVDDVVDAIVRVIDQRARGPFNVGSGEAASTLEIARTMLEIVGGSTDLLRIQPPTAVEPNPGFAALDITRARELLGYAPRSLRDGLTRYLDSLP